MLFVCHRTLLLFITLFLSFFILNSSVWAGDSLPSQSSRFEGMGSTFKEKKQNSGGSGSSLFSKQKKEDAMEEEPEPEILTESSYFKLHTFVINVVDKQINDRLVFLTLEVYCEIKDINDRWLIDTHLPAIKDIIITHVSGIHRDTIQTQKQKKELQQTLSDKTSALIKQLTGKSVINGLYLTRILIQ